MIKIANAQFWVHDQDEALAFYTRTLGWEVRADVTMEEWSLRWLVVGPPGQEDLGLVLMPVPKPPMLDAESSAEASGGEAFACTQSVSESRGGSAIVQSALDRYGRIDILKAVKPY